MLALAPGAPGAGRQIVGPASQVCGQIKGIKDMKKDETPPPPRKRRRRHELDSLAVAA